MSKFYNVDDAIAEVVTDETKFRRAASTYATLGETLITVMHREDASQILVPLEAVSKGMKIKGASNFELRRLTDLKSAQYQLMSKVLGDKGIGAIPFNGGLVFVSLKNLLSVSSLVPKFTQL